MAVSGGMTAMEEGLRREKRWERRGRVGARRRAAWTRWRVNVRVRRVVSR